MQSSCIGVVSDRYDVNDATVNIMFMLSNEEFLKCNDNSVVAAEEKWRQFSQPRIEDLVVISSFDIEHCGRVLGIAQ
jgi:hypothetical protein